MATSTVKWCTETCLDCGGSVPASVVLCVPAAIVYPPVSTTHGFVDATLIGVRPSTDRDYCGSCKTVYTFEFEDSQLLPGTTFKSAYIKEVFCGCLTDFIGQGGPTITVSVTDSESVDLTLNHVGDNYDIQADVNISADPGNIISIEPDGLFAAGGGDSCCVTEGDVLPVMEGVVAFMEGAGDVALPIQGSIADGILVNLGTNNDVTVTGTVNAVQSGVWAVDVNTLPPITGTVTANQGGVWNIGTVATITNLVTVTGTVDVGTITNPVTVTATNLDIRDLVAATDSVTIHGDVGVADQFNLTNSDPFAVAIVDANGDQITSFGSGIIQYTDGDVDATVTGTAIMWKDAGNVITSVSAATPLPVDVGTVTVTGTVNAAQSGAWSVEVNNAAGAAAVNIQDGGNTITVDGTVNVGTVTTITNPVTVTATNLDIRDLTSVSDSVSAVQSGAWNIGTLTSVTNPVTVTATDLDIRDLDCATDSVSICGDVGAVNQFNLTNSDPIAMAIVDANGDQITSFGGSVQYTDGDTDASVTGTAVMWKDAGDVITSVSASTPLPVDVGTVTVTGTVNAAQSGAWSVEVNNAAGAAAVNIQDGGNTITVDGTVNVGTVTTITNPVTVTATNLDIRDLVAASDSVTIHGDVGVADQFNLTNSDPFAVAIVDANGDQITSFGGGTQYTDGDVDASVTGTAVMWKDAGDVITSVSASTPLPVGSNTSASGNNGALNDAVTLSDLESAQTIIVYLKPTGVSTITHTFEVSVNGSDWISISGLGGTTANAGNITSTATVGFSATAQVWVFQNAGFTDFRARISSYTSGSIDVTIIGHAVGAAPYTAIGAIPAGASVIGSVTLSNFAGVGINNFTPADGVAAGAAYQQNSFPFLYNGATYDRLRGDTTGLNAQGNIPHDTADSGNPVKIGGVAVSGSATPTSVAAGDRTRAIFNQAGIPYTMAGHPNLITREYDFGTAAQTDVNLAAAAVAADERVYVTRFEALCDNANTVAVSVRSGFGTANVPAASATGVSGMIASHPGIAPGSGIICGTGAGIIGVGGAGEEPRLTSSAATSGNLHVVISYYLIDETP